MNVKIYSTIKALGKAAAHEGAECIRRALELQGQASIILATGASQFELLENLVARKDIDWSKVEAFHLDEYIDLPLSHPASFRKYLKERVEQKLSVPMAAFHYINGEVNPAEECERLNQLISNVAIDVAFVGIGENCHLAFNDPPADFETESPYIVVDLDEACRMQQLGEGWFESLEEVPRQAISMSICQIIKSKCIICTVPDDRKADAVSKALEGPLTPDAPASILREHPDCRFILDTDSAYELKEVGKYWYADDENKE